MIQTQVTLDLATAHGCETPGCKHLHHGGPLELGPSCHKGAPVILSYTQGSGVLAVACAVCRHPVARIAVAATLKP